MARCLNCMKEYEGFGDICPECGFDRTTPPKQLYHLYPGTELQERYIIGTVVGFGGFGVVYKAWDTMLKATVAIKEYFPVELVSRTPNTREVGVFQEKRKQEFVYGKERFLNEAKIMAKFNTHPSIVSIFDFFEENNTGYIVMEFLEGLSLKEYLINEKNLLDIETALSITESMCDILSVIHQAGILHRDISPDNIFICLGGKIKLLDFGASRLPKINPNLTKILKPGYAPPEQYRSEKQQGSWTDVYALGATLYRMLTGKVPTESINRDEKEDLRKPSDLNPEIPEYLNNVILRAMSMNPDLRYQKMIEFKKALRNEKKARSVDEELKKRKQNRRITVGCVVLFLLSSACTALMVYEDKKRIANLPDTSITMWVPELEKNEDCVGRMEKVLEEFNKNYGDHVEINIEAISYDEYYSALQQAEETENMPDIFYIENRLENNWMELEPPDTEYISFKTLNCSKEIKAVIKKYEMIPSGFNCFVLYENKKLRKDGYGPKISESFLKKIIEGQCEEGIDAYYQDFLNGERQFYFGSTNQYQDILETYGISAYVRIHDVSEVYNCGYLSDYWCINENATYDNKICADAIISYLLKENCQRLFFTVESTRISNSIPLNKEVFRINYYKNGVGDKMEFIKELADKIDIYEITEEDLMNESFYTEVLFELE